MKYRIVKFERPGRIFFEIQEKGFFWGWNNVRIHSCFAGELPITKPAQYPNLPQAVNMVNTLIGEDTKFTQTVVWP